MGYKIARIGDRCTHGATIITGENNFIINDRKMARVGDIVICQIHGVKKLIAQSSIIVISGDKKTSHIASIAECGAKVITGSVNKIIDKEN